MHTSLADFLQSFALLQSFAQLAAPIATAALWQGIAIATGLALCLRFAPRISAPQRFALWTAALATLVCLPFLPALSHLYHSANAAGLSSASDAVSPAPWFALDQRWSFVISFLWIAVSLYRATDLAVHSLRLRALWKSAEPVEILPTFESAKQRRFTLCTTQHLDRPSVIGFFAPRILVPDWLFARLTPAELEQIVLHESEHLRRRDDWTNLLQKLCLVLFPLNPALCWIEHRLCKEREMACDEGVIRVTRAPRAYAACLASMAERGLHHRAEALSLGAWQRRPELVHRVHSILRRKQSLHPAASRALLGTVTCGLFVFALQLARCPQLVAFVPSQARQQATAKPDTQSPKLLDAAYSPIPPRTRQGHGFYALQTSAHMPSNPTQATTPAPRSSNQQPNSRTSSRPCLERTRASIPPAQSPRQQQLVADMSFAQSETSDSQQIVVYTTWQQIDSSIANAQVTSDYAPLNEPAQPAQAAAGTPPENSGQPSTGANSRPHAQVTRSITVTQLIFRVMPKNSATHQPNAVPIGEGWFVIQL